MIPRAIPETSHPLKTAIFELKLFFFFNPSLYSLRPPACPETFQYFSLYVFAFPVDQMEEESHDAMTALKSELAALQYKRDKLLSELNDMRVQIRNRDQKTMELQTEMENLKEQGARQNAIITSLKKRIQVSNSLPPKKKVYKMTNLKLFIDVCVYVRVCT